MSFLRGTVDQKWKMSCQKLTTATQHRKQLEKKVHLVIQQIWSYQRKGIGKAGTVEAAPKQGDQITWWKSRPNCSPTHCSSKLIHPRYRGKKQPKNFRHFCHFQNTAQWKQLPNGQKFGQSGTDVTILKIFPPKNRRKNWRFWLKTKLIKKMIITYWFLKKRQFFPPKIVEKRRKFWS
jgi:hypothetical protein